MSNIFKKVQQFIIYKLSLKTVLVPGENETKEIVRVRESISSKKLYLSSKKLYLFYFHYHNERGAVFKMTNFFKVGCIGLRLSNLYKVHQGSASDFMLILTFQDIILYCYKSGYIYFSCRETILRSRGREEGK